MERRLDNEGVADRGRAHGGVSGAISSQRLAELNRDMTDATARVDAMRSRLSARHANNAGWKALQDLDAAQEELRVAEEELHRQADLIISMREALAREHRVYGALFEGAPEACLATDLNGIIKQANRRASTLFDLHNPYLCGKPLAILIALPDRSRFRDLLNAMGETVLHTEVRLQPHKGEVVWAAVTASRVAANEEDADCICWLFRSADAQKHEAGLRDANEERLRTRVYELEASQRIVGHLLEREQIARKEADEKSLQKERLLAEIAHELRGPLGTIAGWLHIMSNGQSEEGVRKRALLSMTRAVRGLSRIIEELIEHARFERHQVILKPELLNFVRVIAEVIEDLRPLASLKNIRLEFVGRSYAISVHGEAFRLQQVARNLIGNAIKFTPEHGLIRIEMGVVRDQAELTVGDTGRGLEPSAIAKIFEPFAQVGEPVAQRAGLGLGLSIAKRLVELHGGTIEAESEGPQRGSKFRVRLPLAEH